MSHDDHAGNRPQFQFSPQAVAPWMNEYFSHISNDLAAARTEFTLPIYSAPPPRSWDGLTVIADGTTWNPGAGQGVYTYFNASWNKLG